MSDRLAYTRPVSGDWVEDWNWDHELALRLARARKKCGMTGAAAAAVAGLNEGTYSNLERGKRRVSARVLVLLAQAYGVRVQTLLPRGIHPPSTPPETGPCGHPATDAKGLRDRSVFWGVIIWECATCGHRWPRFDDHPQHRHLHDRAVDLIAEFGHGVVVGHG